MTRYDITAELLISVDAVGYTFLTLAHTFRCLGDEKKVVCISVEGALKDCVLQELLHAYNHLSDVKIEKKQKFMNDYQAPDMFDRISVFELNILSQIEKKGMRSEELWFDEQFQHLNFFLSKK